MCVRQIQDDDCKKLKKKKKLRTTTTKNTADTRNFVYTNRNEKFIAQYSLTAAP